MINVRLTKYGMIVPIEYKTHIGLIEYGKILKKHIITAVQPKSVKFAPVKRQAYKLDKKGNLLLPRIYLSELKNVVPIYECDYHPTAISSELKVDLYDYQDDVATYIVDKLSDNGNIYLQMDTGFGKTFTGAEIAMRLGLRTVVCVPSIALAQQWITDLKTMYDASISMFGDGVVNADFTIIVINSFIKQKPSFLEGVGTIIFDEAHEYCSKVNRQCFELAQTKYVIGLSATPADRPDKLDRYVYLFLGNPIIAREISTNIASVVYTAEVRKINYKSDTVETVISAAGTVSAIGTIQSIVCDPHRLQLVASEVLRLFNMHNQCDISLGEGSPPNPDKKHGIMVFAETRDYLPQLYDAIAQLIGADNIIAPEMAVLRGGVDASIISELKHLKNNVVLTTYGYSRRGISLTHMTSIILATPRRNGMTQILGRIFRQGSDASIIRQIVDIVDVCTSLKTQYYDREKIYKSRNFKIISI